ncbi:MAG: diiron oxygenase [Acidobacteriota bacterium]
MTVPAMLARSLPRLSALSEQAAPLPIDVTTPIPGEEWCFSPTALSLVGTSRFETLDERTRRRLARCEAVAFFSANVHGERHLLRGALERLHRPGSEEVSAYLQHLVEEESRHLRLFGTYCLAQAGGLLPEQRLPVERRPSRTDEVSFFARVLLFEDLVDVVNRLHAKDEAVASRVRELHRYHHLEESRHLAFGRLLLRGLVEEQQASWTRAERDGLRVELRSFLELSWRSLFDARAYAAAGLSDAVALREDALRSDAARERRGRWTRRAVSFLTELELMDPEPAS